MTAAEAWNAQATTLEDARAAVWSEPDYEQGTDRCVEAILTALRPDDLPDGPLLELGCGIGRLTFPIAAANPGRKVVGLDVSSNMISLTRDRWHEAVPSASLPHFVVADLGDIVINEGFSGAYSMLTFQHMPPEAVRHCIDQTVEALLPGGRFVFQFVVGDHHEGLDHRYPMMEILNIVQRQGVLIDHWPDSDFPEWTWICATKADRFFAPHGPTA